MELEERERALTPEKTIVDLAWAGGEGDTVIDEDGKLKKQGKNVVLPENDPTLPLTSRLLARENRKFNEVCTNAEAQVKSVVIKDLETLYVQALKDGRVVDAEYYRKNIKFMYPDWEFKGEQ